MKFIKFAGRIHETTGIAFQKYNPNEGSLPFIIELLKPHFSTGNESFETEKERDDRFQELEDMLIPKEYPPMPYKAYLEPHERPKREEIFSICQHEMEEISNGFQGFSRCYKCRWSPQSEQDPNLRIKK